MALFLIPHGSFFVTIGSFSLKNRIFNVFSITKQPVSPGYEVELFNCVKKRGFKIHTFLGKSPDFRVCEDTGFFYVSSP